MSSHTTPEWLKAQDHPEWESSRLGWNLAADQRPTAIAEPATVDEVIAAVNYARQAGLRVAPQATGHGSYVLAAGDGTMVVKLEKMRGVEIDVDSATARVQGGAQWGDVTAASTPHGLAALAGSSPDVGVAGYTTGGGISWLARRHGLACNAVRAVEIVTANGRARPRRPRYQPGSLLGGARGRGRLRRDHRLRTRAVPRGHGLWRGNAVADRTRHRGAPGVA